LGREATPFITVLGDAAAWPLAAHGQKAHVLIDSKALVLTLFMDAKLDVSKAPANERV
jgi:hypothetical protein